GKGLEPRWDDPVGKRINLHEAPLRPIVQTRGVAKPLQKVASESICQLLLCQAEPVAPAAGAVLVDRAPNLLLPPLVVAPDMTERPLGVQHCCLEFLTNEVADFSHLSFRVLHQVLEPDRVRVAV